MDLSNREFWDKLSEVFTMTIKMIEEEAEELGIELDSIDKSFNCENIDMKDEEIEKHKIVHNAKKYLEIADEWFKLAEEDFLDKQAELINHESLELENTTPLDDALTITDAVDIIRWYRHQILVKLKRALFSRIEEKEDSDHEYQKDSDGSAKVALIGIDRSIIAWGKLYNYFIKKGGQYIIYSTTSLKFENTCGNRVPRCKRIQTNRI